MGVLVVSESGASVGSLFWKIGGGHSPTSRHVLCPKHTYGMCLQPALRGNPGNPVKDDFQPGTECPFCKGGPLYKHYHTRPSMDVVMHDLAVLEATLQLQEKPELREEVLDELVTAGISEGDAYRDNRNALRAVKTAIKDITAEKADDPEWRRGYRLEMYEVLMNEAAQAIADYWKQSDLPQNP